MQIIAIGGGGFSDGSRDAALDRYVLNQSGKRRPRVCFIPTASGDAQAYIRRFSRAVRRLGGIPSHLSLFEPPPGSFVDYLRRHDVIYVGGGNTRNLLLLWSAWHLDAAIQRAYESGTVLAGVSAGAICWFRAGLTDSFPGKYATLRALGWLSGSFCPHFDSEPKRQPVYRGLIARGATPGGYAVDDGAALHFSNGKLVRSVSARSPVAVREIRRRGGRLVETSLRSQLLG
jgi:dipeptidase E